MKKLSNQRQRNVIGQIDQILVSIENEHQCFLKIERENLEPETDESATTHKSLQAKNNSLDSRPFEDYRRRECVA